MYWIDAQTGDVIDRVDRILHISAPTTNGAPAIISGIMLDGEGGISTNVWGWNEHSNNKFYLYNTTEHWEIYNASSGIKWPDRATFAHRETDNWEETDPAAISAAVALDSSLRYFREVHNRQGFDGQNSIVRLNVHHKLSFVGSFWDHEQIYVGDGDGVTANSLAVQDFVGHELSHAVIDYSAGLSESGEAGALSESFADIFAANIEFLAKKMIVKATPTGRHGMPIG
ncbi:MAG: hypothetical protein M5U15_05515 [Kiritimatiellae bacterium]|nr:hypothetical protein [Kiritimatiellia bacterium]